MATYYEKDKFGNSFCTDEDFNNLKEIEYIICLNRKEQASQNLFLFCCVCNEDIKGIKACEQHWKKRDHKKKAENHFKKTKHLTVIPLDMSAVEEERVTEFVENVKFQALTKNELKERQAVCQRFERILIGCGLTDICCRLCGSSATGIGFHKAGVDINVQFDIEKISKLLPNVTDTPSFLTHIFDILQRHDNISNLEELFHKKNPKITFTDKKSGLKCFIAAIFYIGYQSTQLINKYLSMDGRVKKLCLAFKYWAKVCCLDDQESGSLPPTSLTIMVIHYLQQLTPPVLPVIEIPDQSLSQYNDVIDEEEELKYIVNENKIEQWKSRNNESLGILFYRLFRYYLVEFHMNAFVITICQIAPMTKSRRKFANNRLAVEDPFLTRESMTNVTKSIMTYFIDCLETSFKYLSGCQQNILAGLRFCTSDGDEIKASAVDDDAMVIKIPNFNDQTRNNIEFIKCNLTPKREFPIVCNICDKEDHYYNKCPLVRRDYKPLKEPTKEWLSILEDVCRTVLHKHELTGEDFQKRLKAVKYIEHHLKTTFSTDARLNLFGSSVNGFGFHQSDMDICLRFSTDEPAPELNMAEQVIKISNCLSKNPNIQKVMHVKWAKIPIVKFKLPSLKLDGDISLYNSLALHNSAMLATYGAIDERVKIMGYCIKAFAKVSIFTGKPS